MMIIWQAALEARGDHRLLGVHRRRSGSSGLGFGLRFESKARSQPQIQIRMVLELKHLRGRLVVGGSLAFRRGSPGGPGAGEPGRRTGVVARISEPPHVRTVVDAAAAVAVGGFVGTRAAAEELWYRPQRAAAEHGLDRGLAHVPVAGPEQPHGAVDRIDRTAAGFKQQRLEQNGTLRIGDGGDEGHEAGAAEELGDEDGGVALGFGGFDPLEARAEHAGFAAALSENSASVAAHGFMKRVWFVKYQSVRSGRLNYMNESRLRLKEDWDFFAPKKSRETDREREKEIKLSWPKRAQEGVI